MQHFVLNAKMQLKIIPTQQKHMEGMSFSHNISYTVTYWLHLKDEG